MRKDCLTYQYLRKWAELEDRLSSVPSSFPRPPFIRAPSPEMAFAEMLLEYALIAMFIVRLAREAPRAFVYAERHFLRGQPVNRVARECRRDRKTVKEGLALAIKKGEEWRSFEC